MALEGSGGSGDDTECVGVLTGTFDNVVVPPGAFCQLQNSTVNGNVKALEHSSLTVLSTTVRGNVDGDKADIVDIRTSFDLNQPRNLVLGSIQVKEGDGFARVCGTDLPNGNIQIEKMRSFVLIGGPEFCPRFIGSGNTLAKGNIKAEENSTSGLLGSGELEISGNSVGGNIQVFKNVGPRARRSCRTTPCGRISSARRTMPRSSADPTSPARRRTSASSGSPCRFPPHGSSSLRREGPIRPAASAARSRSAPWPRIAKWAAR